MAKIHFIVNPLRPSIGLKWPYEEARIEKITKDFKVHISRGRLHAEILTRTAMEEGAELIVSVGGDSTLNQIVNGVYRASLGGRPQPKIALYPGLQKGDAVKSFQLRKTASEFIEAYLAGQGIEEPLDLGEAEFTGDYGQRVRRLFVNCAGFGFSSTLIDRLQRDFRVTRSKFQFMRLVVRLVPFFRHPEVDIMIDGRKAFEKVDILTGLVHNGVFGGHGFLLSSQSSMTDQRFEYTLIFKAMAYRYLLGVFPLFSGRLRKASFVKQEVCKDMQILPTGDQRKVRVDFDGDSWGFLPARFRILEKAMTVIR